MQAVDQSASKMSKSESDKNAEPIAEDVEQEVLDEKQGSIILSLVSQLRKGADLHKVTLPTFVLEPRSMLERISDFVSHPELILEYASCLMPVRPKKTIPFCASWT